MNRLEKINVDGVFIVIGEIRNADGTTTKHVSAVYSDKDAAEKYGKFLIDSPELDGMKYINYEIENFYVL